MQDKLLYCGEKLLKKEFPFQLLKGKSKNYCDFVNL